MGKKYGEQFDSNRFTFGKQDEDEIVSVLSNFFDARNVVSVEPDETYDNYADEKQIHQLIDYTGIDYLVDPFHSPIFGVNHRTHSPTDATLRLDLRKDTGTKSPSELDKLLDSEPGDVLPKYASRLKQSDDGGEWVRIVNLFGLVDEIEGDLSPDKTWTDGDVVAWMYDYDTLRDSGLVVYESEDL